MAELDTIPVYNPLNEDFVCRFNGEPYKVSAKSDKHFPSFLAFHIAKHLSDTMLVPDLMDLKKEAAKNSSPYNPKNAQLMIYDNPRRRMTLYDILKSKELVEQCIQAFPFKGFVGEMAEYDAYVEKTLAKSEKAPKAEKATSAKTKEQTEE